MDVFMGLISPFAFTYAPASWSTCEAQLLPISQNAALFSLLGTSFGGDGVSTFGLPDLRGRLPIGTGNGPGLNPVSFGEKSGTNTITLTAAQTPLAAHTHTATFTPTSAGSSNISVSTDAPSAATPVLTNSQTAYLANASAGINLKGLYTLTAPAPGATATIPVNGGGSGGTVAVEPNSSTPASPVSLMNPYLALNFCIALTGLYPSRN